MEYGLGVDLGTTYTAAAVNVDGALETVRLGGRGPEIPSLVFLRDDGEVLIGEAAQRRGESAPTRLAREFKRRMGDPVPVLLGDTPLAAHELTARLLKHVVAAVTDGRGGPPARIVLTHPANWGPYKRERLEEAARLADLPSVSLRTEPEAAAVRYAGTARVAVGEIIAVYDLGGGTFDAAVLRKTADGFEMLGEPQGVEQLGGIDFDEAVLEHVRSTLGDRLAGLDLEDAAVTEALARLRRECVEAKESLSFDTEAEIGVALPRLHTRVRIRRSDFEAMISPALDETVEAMRRALRSAKVEASSLRCVMLAGGSSRIPLVGLMVSKAFERPVVVDEQPELGIALGAARLSGPGAATGALASSSFVVLPPPRKAPDDAPATPAVGSAAPLGSAAAPLGSSATPVSPAAQATPGSPRVPVTPGSWQLPVTPVASGSPPPAGSGSARGASQGSGVPVSGPPVTPGSPAGPGSPGSVPPDQPGRLPPAPVASLPVSVRPPGLQMPPDEVGPPVPPASPATYSPPLRAAAGGLPPRAGGPPGASGAAGHPGGSGAAGHPGGSRAAGHPGGSGNAGPHGGSLSGSGEGGRSRWRAYRWPIIGGFAAVLLTVTAVSAVAAWPWSDDRREGSAGSGGSTGTSAVAQPGAQVLWRVNTGVPAVEPPAVGGQWILVSGQDGTLRAYRRTDGALSWEMELGPGARADARIVNGVAYAVTGAGRIIAVDATYGSELWHRDTGHDVAARPAVDEERVYAGDGDGVLYAYEIGEKHRRWRAWSEGKIGTSPVVSDGIVVVASGDGKLNGVSDQGAVLWRAEAGKVTDGPVVAGDAVCVAIANGTVRCVELKDGAELDGIADQVSVSRIAGGDGMVLTAGADGSISAWDARTSDVRWRYRPEQGGAAGIPVVRGGEVDVAYPDGRLVGLDARTGSLLWQNVTGDRFEVAASGDGAGLFAVGASGTLYALRPPGSNSAAIELSPTALPTSPATLPATEPTAETTTRRRTTSATTRPTRSRSVSPSATRTTTPTSSPTTSRSTGTTPSAVAVPRDGTAAPPA
ncbi:Hsp70 family protein [Actinoplanes sp. CA-142083]|uniref:Hsp70 family protein n=1 Tax=Actinoplanes sp. CA-142083 TaxID=3239903 RepID=UPI003D92F9E9